MKFNERSIERIAKETRAHERRVRGKPIASGGGRAGTSVGLRIAKVEDSTIARRQQGPEVVEPMVYRGKVKFYDVESVNESTMKLKLQEEDSFVFNLLNRSFTKDDEVLVLGQFIVGVNLKGIWEYKLFSAEEE